MFAKVALRDVDKIFDYNIPCDMEKFAYPGERVLVPFGMGNRTVSGIIVEISQDSSVKNVKPIKKLLDTAPLCTEELMLLAKWMSERYFCSYYAALKCIMPTNSVRVEEFVEFIEDGACSIQEQKVVQRIREGGRVPILRLADIPKYREVVQSLVDKGIIRHVVTDSGISKKTQKVARIVDGAWEYIDALKKRAPAQARILEILYDEGEMFCSEVDGGYSTLKSLERKGLVEIYEKNLVRMAFDADNYKKTVPHKPTEEQNAVIEYLKKSVDGRESETVLLRGVTGSGKTEVFLQTIEYVRALGLKSIVLVPEISLTPQMVERFVGRFGGKVSVLHSSLSSGERYDEWRRILNDEVDVVVGARSAIFAPFSKIGIIIIDEEQEGTYKSENAPRYRAHEVAKKRAITAGAPILLATATPSVETFHRAETGEYKLFEMSKRYNDVSMPKVKIVDMRRELQCGNRSIFSQALTNEIWENLEKKEQTILFLNRRGYNTFVSCRSCGEAMKCIDCNITLTYHKKTGNLVCHYCGYTMQNPTECPECNSPYIRYFGDGTQKLEDEIARLFPGASYIRMDMDTTVAKNSHEMILAKFRDEKIDILIGTQMVTKGLDFKNVSLVGVMAADLSLNSGDFRAGERTFSLLTQVCGRAGRGDAMGRAVIQTYEPDNEVIKYSREHNYTGFYNQEILIRKHFKNPPFCDIITIMAIGEDEAKVAARMDSIWDSVQDIEGAVKPVPAPLSKLNGRYRYRCLIKTDGQIHDRLQEISRKYQSDKDVSIIIDVNPNSML